MADPPSRPPSDSVDALLASWRNRRPDLDFTPVGVVSRLRRVRGHIDAALDDVFATHGLTAADFAVLVTLARVDDGDGVSQRRLMDELSLTSGTISVRMDRLVGAKLVDRSPDPRSGRSTLIRLTADGRALFERVVPAHLDNERRMLCALSDDEQQLLAGLLRKLLVEYEGWHGSPDPALALGLTLAPAHVTAALRADVGLEPIAGLLVRATDDDGAAARAGVRTGDVLVRGAGRELRSIGDLHAAIDDDPARLRLVVVRGDRRAPPQRPPRRARAGGALRGRRAAPRRRHRAPALTPPAATARPGS